jgi:hypothetical protein
MAQLYIDYPLTGSIFETMQPGSGRAVLRAKVPSDFHHLRTSGLMNADAKIDNVLFEVLSVAKDFPLDLVPGDICCIAAPGMDMLDSGTLTVVVQAPDVLGHWPRAAFEISEDEAAKRIKANRKPSIGGMSGVSQLITPGSGLIGI